MKILSCCLLCLMLLPVRAQSLTVVNHGFEDISGETPVDEFTFGALNGWDIYGAPAITDGGNGPNYFVGTLTPTAPVFFDSGAPEGIRVGLAFNFSGSGDGGEYGLEQTLSDTLLANTRYTLEVEIGNIASGTSEDSTFYNLDGFPGYRVDLLADGVILASDNNSLAGSIPEGEFRTSTLVWDSPLTVTPGQLLGIRLVNLNQTAAVPVGAHLEVDFDNVRLSAVAIPEPASLILALMAFGGFAAVRYVRSQKA